MTMNKRIQFFFVSKNFPEKTFSVAIFEGHEAISELYSFEIILVSEESEINLKDILFKPAMFIIEQNNYTRTIHGILSKFEQQREINQNIVYKAVLVPRLWLADQYHENQLFLDKSIPDIIEEILHQTGLSTIDYKFALKANYPKWEYICQYKETDFNFISRWLEREGIYYFFEQTESHEKLIITDHHSIHADIPNKSNVLYKPPSGLVNTEETISFFSCSQYTLPQKIILNDYNYRKPSLDLKTVHTVDPNGRGSIYMYGEHYKTPSEGKHLAKIRSETLVCREQIYNGNSTINQFSSGFLFSMSNHYRNDFNKPYLITKVAHHGSQSFHGSSIDNKASNEDNVEYGNAFSAILSENNTSFNQFRPERVSEKPKIHGTMNALIDAEGNGQYAEIDQYGRYKVILPFDMSDKKDGKASRWVRMMQPYAGEEYGMHLPLHKGTEIILSFVDGDPDRPIINGSLPNPNTMSPITQENQTQHMIRSCGGNEVHFDDTKGKENIYTHATKNANTKIGNDRNQHIASNESRSIAANKNENVGADNILVVGGNRNETIGSNSTLNVGADKIQVVSADSSESISSSKNINAGTSVLLSAGSSITLKCGASKISLKSSGIVNISGTLVMMLDAVDANISAPVTSIAGGIVTNVGAINKVKGKHTHILGCDITLSGGKTEVIAELSLGVKGALTSVIGGVTSVIGKMVMINCGATTPDVAMKLALTAAAAAGSGAGAAAGAGGGSAGKGSGAGAISGSGTDESDPGSVSASDNKSLNETSENHSDTELNREKDYIKALEKAGCFSSDDKARAMINGLSDNEIKNIPTEAKKNLINALLSGYVSEDDKESLKSLYTNFNTAETDLFKQLIDESGYFSRDDMARDILKNCSNSTIKNLPTDVKAHFAENLVGGYFSDDDKDSLASLFKQLNRTDYQPNSDVIKQRQLKQALLNDIAIQNARSNWNTLTEVQRQATLQSVADYHANIYGIPTKTLAFKDLGSMNSFGYYSPSKDEVVVSNHTDSSGNNILNNVSEAFATVAHENTHRYQNILIDNLNKGSIRKADDTYHQARLMRANSEYYFSPKDDYSAYRSQPKEAHAWQVEGGAK